MSGTPSYWQPDEEVNVCPACSSEFSILLRRHHCRVCGLVYCGSCCPYREVQLTPGGAVSSAQRTCSRCLAVATFRATPMKPSPASRLPASPVASSSASPATPGSSPPRRALHGSDVSRLADRSAQARETQGSFDYSRRPPRTPLRTVRRATDEAPLSPPRSQPRALPTVGSQAGRRRAPPRSATAATSRAATLIAELLRRLEHQAGTVEQLEDDRTRLRAVCASLREQLRLRGRRLPQGGAADPPAIATSNHGHTSALLRRRTTTPTTPGEQATRSEVVSKDSMEALASAVDRHIGTLSSDGACSDDDNGSASFGELVAGAFPECRDGTGSLAVAATTGSAGGDPTLQADAGKVKKGRDVAGGAPLLRGATHHNSRETPPPIAHRHSACANAPAQGAAGRHVCSHLITVTFDTPGPTGLVLVPSLSSSVTAAGRDFGAGGSALLASAVDGAVQHSVRSGPDAAPVQGSGGATATSVMTARSGAAFTTTIVTSTYGGGSAAEAESGPAPSQARPSLPAGSFAVSVARPAKASGGRWGQGEGGTPWDLRVKPLERSRSNGTAAGATAFDPADLLPTAEDDLLPFSLAIAAVMARLPGTAADPALLASPAQLHNASAAHACCGLLRPGLVLVAVNGVPVAGVGPAQLGHVLKRAPHPLTLSFVAHPLATLRAQHAALLGRYHDLGHKAGRLARLFRSMEASHATAAAAAAAKLASESAAHEATSAALSQAMREVMVLRSELASAQEARRVAEAQLTAYTGGASVTSRALLARRRMTVMERSGRTGGDDGPGSPGTDGSAPTAVPGHPASSLSRQQQQLHIVGRVESMSGPEERALLKGTAALSALLAASTAAPPVTLVGADGVVVTAVGGSGGGHVGAAGTPVTAGGAAEVVIYDPLFPTLKVPFGSGGEALAVSSGRRGLGQLQERLTAAASESAVSAALAFLARVSESNAAVRGALLAVLGRAVLDDPDNDGRGGSIKEARAAAKAASAAAAATRAHAQATASDLLAVTPSGGSGTTGPPPLLGGSGGLGLGPTLPRRQASVDSGAGTVAASANSLLGQYRAGGGATASPAAVSGGGGRPDITALRLLQALVHRDAAVAAAEEAAKEARELAAALASARRDADVARQQATAATVLSEELHRVLHNLLDALASGDGSAGGAAPGVAAARAELLVAVNSAARGGLVHVDALVGAAGGGGGRGASLPVAPKRPLRDLLLAAAAQQQQLQHVRPQAPASTPAPELLRMVSAASAAAVVSRESASQDAPGPEAYLSPGSAARPLPVASGLDALSLWDRYKAVSQRAALTAAVLEEKDGALRHLQARCAALHEEVQVLRVARLRGGGARGAAATGEPPSAWHSDVAERELPLPPSSAGVRGEGGFGSYAPPPKAPSTGRRLLLSSTGRRRLLGSAKQVVGPGVPAAPPSVTAVAEERAEDLKGASAAAGAATSRGTTSARADSWDDVGDEEEEEEGLSRVKGAAPPPPTASAAAQRLSAGVGPTDTAPDRASRRKPGGGVLGRVFTGGLFKRGRTDSGGSSSLQQQEAAAAAALDAAAPLPEPSQHALTIARRAIGSASVAGLGVSSSSTSTLEAELQKRSRYAYGGSWSNWAARFVRLGDGALLYYKSEFDMRPQGCVALADVTLVAPCADSPSGGGGSVDGSGSDHAFLLRLRGGKEFQFASESARTTAVWVAVLQAVVFLNREAAVAREGAPAAPKLRLASDRGTAAAGAGALPTTNAAAAPTVALPPDPSRKDSDLD